MKVAIIGILVATYLTFSYKCKSFILYWQNQVVEISIISILALSLIFSYNNEPLVWMLVVIMGLHQIIQLYLEASARLKEQKKEVSQLKDQVSLSA